MTRTTESPTIPWRILGWGAAGGLLLLPAVAMQFTREVVWSGSDFAAMGAMLLLAGLALEGLLRASRSLSYRLGAGLTVLAGFLLVWVNLAVGFLGDEEDPANLAFALVLLIVAAGAVAGRFRAAAMANTLVCAALAQIAIAIGGWALGHASPGGQGLYEVALGSTLFGGLWLGAAALFRRAARREVR